MRREVDAVSTLAHSTETYSYIQVETVREVVEALRDMVTTRSEQCAIVTITLHFTQDKRRRSLCGTHRRQSTRVESSVRYYLKNIRPLVRRTDMVLLLHNTYYFILPAANVQGGRIVLERLWDALLWRIHNTMDAEILRPCQIHTGYSAYPEPSFDFSQCVVAASKICLSFGESEPRPQGEEEELPRLARKLGVPYLSALPRQLPENVRSLINPRLAQELCCYPLGRARDVLTVAVSDPQDRQTLDRLRRETGLHIFPVLTPLQELHMALEQLI